MIRIRLAVDKRREAGVSKGPCLILLAGKGGKTDSIVLYTLIVSILAGVPTLNLNRFGIVGSNLLLLYLATTTEWAATQSGLG
jgi:hypothetical protein